MSTSTTDKEKTNELELQKLRLEIEELKTRNKWYGQLGQFLPFLTVLVAAIGLLISNAQFNRKLEEERAVREIEANRQADRDAKSREDEFRKPFWEQRLKLYIEAADAASTIATLPSQNSDRKKAVEKFWRLYWGPLISVEDLEDSKAMVDFGNCLEGFAEECRTEEERPFKLKELSFNIANQFRKSLAESWNVELKNLPMQK
jgi:hypothetical protein